MIKFTYRRIDGNDYEEQIVDRKYFVELLQNLQRQGYFIVCIEGL